MGQSLQLLCKSQFGLYSVYIGLIKLLSLGKSRTKYIFFGHLTSFVVSDGLIYNFIDANSDSCKINSQFLFHYPQMLNLLRSKDFLFNPKIQRKQEEKILRNKFKRFEGHFSYSLHRYKYIHFSVIGAGFCGNLKQRKSGNPSVQHVAQIYCYCRHTPMQPPVDVELELCVLTACYMHKIDHNQAS